ncbi:hypothetical protein FOQG_16602 [Fusarium oxysporum f. sp. raphani 54005]|uniref:Rhodopsin domain-containing protein n=2 Tax=Fusarium oxysporum TaxID=5507 RepID=X0BAH0_FUSOX|nr:hypothetical protein FOZG_17722 [Fusarium oxysporum Fo47]EXK78751.1 hypothetical protein FOQG_16602 [Fusarium oxysporum f. sp. raphani 54005]EXL52780.1 hypothetical protein FOCG_08543 [Fusarium oxysporum f. sp. radicis-lycopersici 26381]KAJ9413252.1 hypothetical protein QL093DRAFT_2107852 [Fusarium oxysporum]
MNDGAINVSISVFVTLALAALALVLRLAARRSTKMDLGPDDMLAIVAFVSLPPSALIWKIADLRAGAFHWGLGQSLGDLTDENAMHDILTKSRLSLFIVELLYSFSISSSKLAILAFYWRLFKTSNIRVPILVFAGMSIIWLVVRIFLTIFHCIPIQAFWNKTMRGAKCAIDESRFFFGTVLVHCLIDIAILVLPIMPVRHLHLHSAQKIVVIALFTFGILVCIASIILLVESLKFNVHTKDMPHDIVMIIIWSTVEVNLAIVSSNSPSLLKYQHLAYWRFQLAFQFSDQYFAVCFQAHLLARGNITNVSSYQIESSSSLYMRERGKPTKLARRIN